METKLKEKIDNIVDNYCYIERLSDKNAKVHIMFKMNVGTGITLSEGFTRQVFSEDGFKNPEAIEKAKNEFRKSLTEICENNGEVFRDEVFKKAQGIRSWIFGLEPIRNITPGIEKV